MVLRVDGKWIHHPIPDTEVQIGLITGVFFHSALLAEEDQGNQMEGYTLIDSLFIKALIVSCHSA